jgi:hypothetical protein
LHDHLGTGTHDFDHAISCWCKKTPTGAFSVKTMYRALNITHALPFKIKILVWYIYKGVTLTKDNLARKNWHGDLKCSFCIADENIQHLFFDFPLA